MTPEQKAVLVTAVDIARAAPERTGSTFSCRIPWALIVQLRADLEAMHVDWRRTA